MKIIEYSDYILGKKYMRKLKAQPFRADENFLDVALKTFKMSPTALINIKHFDLAKDFYSVETDLMNAIPKPQREEMFYGLKLGYVSPIVPAKCLYFLSRVKEETLSIQYLPKVIPTQLFADFTSENYLAEGYTLRDVICTFVDAEYSPVSLELPYCKRGNCYDVYIESEDAIARMPDKLVKLLSLQDIASLTVEKHDICLHGKPIRFLGGFLGVTNSTYDLSTLI